MPTRAFIDHGEKARWVTAAARAAMDPAVTGMTLGIVRQRGFATATSRGDGAALADDGGAERFRALLAGRPMLILVAARAEAGAERC